MVDVSDKAETARTAKATAVVRVGTEAYNLIQQNQIKKGDVLTVAQVVTNSGLCDSTITEPDIDIDVEILQNFVILRCY